MTPEAQRIAVAEFCGWLITRLSSHGRITGFPPKNRIPGKIYDIPDYLNDLNAMREAELKLTGDQWRILLGFLNGKTTIPRLMSMDEFHKCWNATALQRAEALLRTIGKWVE